MKLTKPWSEMTDLTDDQKSKIAEIHTAATSEMDAIRAKEKADIEALLTDDQKTEVKTLTKAPSKKKAAADAAAGG